MAERTAEAGRARTGGNGLSLKTFAAFSSRDFRYLWANNFSYALVQGIQRFAFVWLAIELSDSNSVLGLVSFALGIPVFFIALPAGVLSDRSDRRVLLFGSQLVVLAASLLTGVLIWIDVMSVGAAIVMAIFVGIGVAFGQPVRQALVPAIVPPDRLMNAITLNSLGQNVSQIGGPAVGGAAIALWGIGGSFAVQAVLMGLGLLLLIPLRIPPSAGAARAGRRIRAEIGEGFSFIRGAADVRALFLLLLATALVIMGPWQTLLPKIANEQLGAGAFAASMLFAAMGAGTIVSSLVLASIPGLKNAGGWFTCTLVTGGILAVGIGFSHSYALTLAFMLLSGFNAGFFVNLNMTLIQSHTPAAVMGRVMAIYTLVLMGASPLGSLVAGGGAELLGAGGWFSLSGGAVAVIAIVFLLTQPSLRRMPSAPEVPVATPAPAPADSTPR